MKRLIFTMLFLAIGPYSVWSNMGITTDYKLRSEKLEIANVPTSDRKCLSTAGLFHQCGLKFQHAGESKRFDYQFLAFGSPKLVYVLRGTQSGELTTSVAQDYFWSRIATILLGVLISLLTLIVVLKTMFGTPPGNQGQAIATPRRSEKPATQASPANANGPLFGKRSV